MRAGDEIDVVTTETRTATYLYDDGSTYHFMDTENFDEFALPNERIKDLMIWIRENDTVTLLLQDNGAVLSVDVPTFVTLQVVQADASVRGDTATNVQKNVTLRPGPSYGRRPSSKRGTS